MKRASVVILVFLAVFVMASGAFAKEANPCAGDLVKFCPNVKPGEGRQANCLRQHDAQLSPACRAYLAEVKEELKEVQQACDSDIKKFCRNVKPGEGRMVECLEANKHRVSPRCKAKMAEAEKKKK